MYHIDEKINSDCVKVLNSLYSWPKSIRQLGSDLGMGLYNVTVALDVLRSKNLAVRTTREDSRGTGKLFEAI